jgi:uncharacterized protein YbcI
MDANAEPRGPAPPVRNAISSAMARIKRDHYGRGPARTRTYIFDRFVFAVLDDVLTPAEQALKDAGRLDRVRHIRLTFQAVMTRTFTGAVEERTGAAVVGYHSQVVFDPDLALEFFVLDRPLDSETDQEPARPGEGPLRASLASALIAKLHDAWGKGPTRARVYVEDQFVFCVFDDPFTTVERTLLEAGESAVVRGLRIDLHDAQRAAFEEVVAQATGRPVRTSMTQVVFDPDLMFLCFMLGDGPIA